MPDVQTAPQGKEAHSTSGYTSREEIANSVIHGIGLILAVAGLVIAVVFASLHRGAALIVGCSVYGATLVLLYAASMLYHAVRNLHWKRGFLVLDHSCIYLVIAGTYTPFTLGPLRGRLGWLLFGVIWGLAIAGILKEAMVKKRGGLWSAMIYLGMGWLCILAVVPLYVRLSRPGFALLLAGGLAYSLGVIFYLWHGLKYHHAVWHLFVVAGSVCQFLAVLSLFG